MYTNDHKMPAQSILECNHTVRVENGTLIVNCDEYYEGGSSQLITLQVTPQDEVRLERLSTPTYPSEMPVRHAAGTGIDAFLAMHIRKTAMPLLTRPEEGLADGVELMVAAAAQCLTMRPVLTLIQ